MPMTKKQQWTIPFYRAFAYMKEEMIPETEKDNFVQYPCSRLKKSLGEEEWPYRLMTVQVLNWHRKY